MSFCGPLSGWEEEGHFVIPPHVASTSREVRRHALLLGCMKVPTALEVSLFVCLFLELPCCEGKECLVTVR